MTPAELLIECRKLDIVFKIDGNGGLKIDAPSGVLVPGLLARLKANKAALLALIEAEQVNLDPDWWRPAAKLFHPRAWPTVANGGNVSRPAGCCPKCGSTTTTDVERYEGKLIRRDCAKCRKFVAFVRWYDVEQLPDAGRN